MDAELQSQLLDLLYGAALDDSLWQPFMKRMSDALGGIGGALVLTDNRSPLPLALKMTGALADIRADYAANWWQHDPKPVYAMARSRSTVFTNRDYESGLDEAGREFRQWEFRSGLYDHLTGVALIDAQMKLGLSIPGACRRSVLTPSNVNLLRTLLPHLRRAVELGWRHAEALEDGFWQSVSARDPSRAILLLTRSGGILRASDAARRILNDGDGLRLAQSRLYCDHPGQNERLAKAVAKAAGNESIAADAFQVERGSGKRPYVLTVYPVARRTRFLPVDGAAMVVTITDRSAMSMPSDRFFERLFQFTPREAQLAGLLHAGHSVETAAFTMQISLPTARLHLRRVLAKAGCSKQSDLIRLLSTVFVV